jgi:hypothetical protein
MTSLVPCGLTEEARVRPHQMPSPYLPLLILEHHTRIIHPFLAKSFFIMASKIQNVTEFSYVTLNEGVNVFDESAAAKTYQNVLETALKQPGARRVYTGVEVENPSTLWLFLDWESLEDHENYPKTA